MTRFDDWTARLEEYLDRREAMPFRFGANDCCLFVCGAIEAMTGTDPAAAVRGKYKTRGQARAALMAAWGVDSARAAVEHQAQTLGMERRPPAMAQRGDVAVLRSGYGVALGVVALNGQQIAAVADKGLTYLPLSAAVSILHV